MSLAGNETLVLRLNEKREIGGRRRDGMVIRDVGLDEIDDLIRNRTRRAASGKVILDMNREIHHFARNTQAWRNALLVRGPLHRRNRTDDGVEKVRRFSRNIRAQQGMFWKDIQLFRDGRHDLN